MKPVSSKGECKGDFTPEVKLPLNTQHFYNQVEPAKKI